MAKASHPETRDVWPRALLLSGVGLLVFLALIAIALGLVFDTTPYWPLVAAGTNNEAKPALQRVPKIDLAVFCKQEDQELRKVAWVNRNAGIARIPIEDAMKLVTAHGLPEWTPQSIRESEDCALLEGEVPRAPQVRKCATGRAPPDSPPPASGARP
ncbi:hypothetical protein [Mesorhizobium sp. B2-3-4]|uniref:hypothetical protein n=1 Tax=Mesorhizobium sp. B2-3-4 TaxID=2589959 RepID=UPI00112606DF|nr:hypothetical protein [Mesorhizobium sp. B2-3-4]TPM34640.1 hypothetical protein FJ967_21625 [Mesorhizobium sp. B2-3-4]